MRPHLLPVILSLVPTCGFVSAQEQRWEPLPLITAAQRAAGLSPGGEGCQYPGGALEADPVDGRTLIYGTDVGGIFRSGDGAQRWHPANLGWKANGAIDVAFDPRNPERVFAVGTISGNQFVQADGVYLSLDRGKTWSQVLAVPRIVNERITGVASVPSRPNTVWAASERQLLRSEDAGATFTAVAGDGSVQRFYHLALPAVVWVDERQATIRRPFVYGA